MASFHFASTEICSVRVSKLNQDGSKRTTGPNGYVTSNVVGINLTRNRLQGQVYDATTAAGCVAAYKRNRSHLLNMDVNLELAPGIDPDLVELLSFDNTITSGGNVIGGMAEALATCAGCDDCAPNNTDEVAIEWWTRAWNERRQATDATGACQWYHFVIPRVQFTMADDSWQFNQGFQTLKFEGYSIQNLNWGTGWTTNPFTAPVLRPYHYELTIVPPPPPTVGMVTIV